MAGVTDRPFRLLCRALGAGLAASEMITSDMRLWHTSKSRQRMDHEGEPEPRVVQLAGADPAALAAAARANVALGDRKSTRLNSSHEWSSYAVCCLKKKRKSGQGDQG